MRIQLSERERSAVLVVLTGELPAGEAAEIRYATRTGALLRIDGSTVGAFDREHRAVMVDGSDRVRPIEIEVERHALPTNGLPSGPGLRWWLMQRMASPEPKRYCDVVPGAPAADTAPQDDKTALALWGHSHLDVAWLWTYEETKRKAQRTFANAVALLDADHSFVFMQSQPQLYAFVRDIDPELFERVRTLARVGRFDPDVAAMWVEPDCNIPSGESLIRQMQYANAFCIEAFRTEPSIAWLPDTFGFANTIPSLLSHCGIRRFATTKLQWNDTTKFPHTQFRWRGPDGADVTAAMLVSYEGEIESGRVQIATERDEPLIAGYGDGGGGVTTRMLAAARGVGTWQRPSVWFDAIDRRRDDLPMHIGELYLEYHRGVATTHRDLKVANARAERLLAAAEEATSWCVAVKSPQGVAAALRARLHDAWEIVLRNQFHDVLPGTSIAAVNADACNELARAEELATATLTSARNALPRGPKRADAAPVPPVRDGDTYVFGNELIDVRVAADGSIIACSVAGSTSLVTQANRLALYRDTPKKWEAWNLDAGYARSPVPITAQGAEIVEGALEVHFTFGSSMATMRVSLNDGEPWLRVELAVDWHERKRLLRVESDLAFSAPVTTFGTPHGVVERSNIVDSPGRSAQFEVPGQRFAFARDGERGIAIFTLDTYGWSAHDDDGALAIGHSLLRSTSWPDPGADRGGHLLSWAFAPFGAIGVGALERAWSAYADEPRVRLFTAAPSAVMVVACKPAEDGDGVIVRVRECDGVARVAALRCGGRMREAVPVDGLERPLDAEHPRMEAEEMRFNIQARGLRSFRVRF